MNYLRSVVLREQPQRDLYLNDIPAVQQLIRVGHLDFPRPVTVFVGENGTGKSTILEAIAIAMGFNARSGVVSAAAAVSAGCHARPCGAGFAVYRCDALTETRIEC